MFRRLLKAFDLTRRLLANLVFLLVIVLLMAMFIMQGSSVPDRAALVLNLKGMLVEQLTLASPVEMALVDADLETRMKDILDAIRMARDDAHIRLMVLDLEDMEDTPLSRLQVLREAILNFRASGKKVISIGENYSQSQYYLAACADTIFLHPQGAVLLNGYGLYQPYFKDALDKLQAEVHVFRAGQYKSLAEPFSRNDMSDAVKKNNRAWLEDWWHVYKHDVASQRHVGENELQAMLDYPAVHLEKYGGNLARLAQGAKLADRLEDRFEAERYIVGELGDEEADLTEISIGFREYLQAAGHDNSPEGDRLVGVVVASGAILDGEQPPGLIGGDTLAQLLSDAGQDTRVRAVVLRVDSPGGSALASEVIRKAVIRLKAAGKPLLVSMGSLAASGGYWISAPADEIWASPTTITGSIGVIGLYADLHQGLKAFGIHSDGVGTTAIAGGLRPDRPLHPELARTIQMSVDDAYRRFLHIVSEGRHMQINDVQGLAQGKVYSGRQAAEIGLVDKLGGLDAAVHAAAEKAEIQDAFDVVYFETGKGLPEMMLERLMGGVRAIFGTPAGWWSGVQGVGRQIRGLPWLRFNDPAGLYAYYFGGIFY